MADTNILNEAAPSTESSPAAYTRLLPRVLTIDPTRFAHMNLDVMHAVITVIGCMPRLRTLRAKLIETLNDFNAADFDDLDDIARALQHAHGLCVQATQRPSDLKDLVERASPLRDVLHTDALALAKRGLLNPDSFKEVKRTNGYRALILDLQVLVATFRSSWPAIAGRTAVQAEELDAAVALIDTLTEAVGAKEQSPAVQAEAVLIRRKAFTLFMNVYDDISHGVRYVRRKEGDADTFAPSPYPARTAGRPAEEPELPTNDGLQTAPELTQPSAPIPALTPDLASTVANNGPFKRQA